jgi:hypothetical protein
MGQSFGFDDVEQHKPRAVLASQLDCPGQHLVAFSREIQCRQYRFQFHLTLNPRFFCNDTLFFSGLLPLTDFPD